MATKHTDECLRKATPDEPIFTRFQESPMIPVLVTTDKRGVFFGYVAAMPVEIPGTITLADARNCYYWSATEHKGVFGLASFGPGNGSRIGPKVPELLLSGITSVSRCTPEAAGRWENGTWS